MQLGKCVIHLVGWKVRFKELVVNEVKSGWWPVTNGAPQGSILGTLLFVFINGLDAGVECTLSKFANYNKLGGAVEFLKGREAWID